MAMIMISLLFLLLALAPLSNSKVFDSIDCGSAKDSYTDTNTIKWISDKTLIQEGESYSVQESLGVVNIPLRTLRAFTAGTEKQYCYKLRAEKGVKVLVRPWFYYGNYDGKMTPPSFALYVNGNFWITVSFPSIIHFIYTEAIYTPKRDFISLCVAQTAAGQFPLISAIEVRSLGPNMYSHLDSNRALVLSKRMAFGGTNIQLVRYPNDEYD